MSIVTLTKCSILGPPEQQADTLLGLQELGICHIIPLARNYRSDIPYSEQAMRAVRYLNDCPEKLLPRRTSPRISFPELLERIETNRVAIQNLTDWKDNLEIYASNLRHWGYFRLPALGELAGLRLWFYRMPKAQVGLISASAPPWQVVGEDGWSAFVVAVSREPPPDETMPVQRLRMGGRNIQELERQLDEIEAELDAAKDERSDLTRYLPFLTRGLAAFNDDIARRRVAGEIWVEPQFFALQGWVPAADQPRVVKFAEVRGLAVCFEEPADEDRPPTLLKNPSVFQGGEDLVGFFSTPGYRSWDPSIVVFISFGIFFSIILGDAGYAGIFLIALLWGWSRMGKTAAARRLRALAVWLTGGSLTAGVLLGSYFGMDPPEGGVLHSVWLASAHDTDTMIKLSLVLGVAHLSIANTVKILKYWPRWYAFGPLGWIFMLVGGLVAYLSGSLTLWSEYLIGSGALLVLLFTGHYAPVSVKQVLLQLWEGIHSLIHFTKAFGDTLSYLRLFALCLAGASLAQVFNDQGLQIIHTTGAFGIIFGPLVILIGHVLNLMLSIMGGAVHGLRLNFIEFLSWTDTEDGTPFSPLRNTTTQE
ncbi:MAG: V-type ATPase 116kDa subunit family protein [Pseudomonadota bacterium]